MNIPLCRHMAIGSIILSIISYHGVTSLVFTAYFVKLTLALNEVIAMIMHATSHAG